MTLPVWLSYVWTGCELPEAMSNKRMWGLPPAARYTLSVLISILLTCTMKTRLSRDQLLLQHGMG